jgi:hypothetical protein
MVGERGKEEYASLAGTMGLLSTSSAESSLDDGIVVMEERLQQIINITKR